MERVPKDYEMQITILNRKLAFVAQAVPAGRLFTRHLIALSSKVTKLHHRIKLNKEAQDDIIWWQQFLPGWNGTTKFITWIEWKPMTWTCTQMAPENMAAEHTSREPGSSPSEDHTNGSHKQSLSSGKSYLPSWLQP